ncbi:hypothetical protein V6N13_122495 [Hibiscus sabdariffa]
MQVSLQGDKGNPNFYDVRLVDGYNLPVLVATRLFSPKCTNRGCSKNLNNLCPQELQVVNKDGKVVACRSACLAFDIDSFYCRNEYETPEKCKPSVYSKIFKVKDACHCYYSYAFDMPPPLAEQQFVAPWSWNGQIWARTGCKFESNWQPACETSDCDGRLQCNGLIGKPLATLMQVALQGDKGNPNFYDVSQVDGYNLPVSVATRPFSPKCTNRGCSKNLNNFCPHELQVVNKDGKVVACRSACLAFNIDSFCCRNEYETPEKCKPSVYSKIFKVKDACHCYYSYAFDMPPPLVNCASKEYVRTFCFSAWGLIRLPFRVFITFSGNNKLFLLFNVLEIVISIIN